MRLEPRQCDFSDADQRKPQPVSFAVIRRYRVEARRRERQSELVAPSHSDLIFHLGSVHSDMADCPSLTRRETHEDDSLRNRVVVRSQQRIRRFVLD